jgi:hypothetical protein
MSNTLKEKFLEQLAEDFGTIIKLPGSLSLYDIGNNAARIYIRYSKTHSGTQTFYGLRKDDLKALDGRNSILCFLWDNQEEPLFIPYSEFEDVFNNISPASDGQYKAQIFLNKENTEFYIANAGRYNVEAYYGWDTLSNLIESDRLENLPDFSHYQIQTFIGAIGTRKGYDIWIPQIDRSRLDEQIADNFIYRGYFPSEFDNVKSILQEIDVIWFEKGSSNIGGLFEVEHSTPIYSGLLRFNDIHLVIRSVMLKCRIVSNEIRRSLFMKQIMRPTFQTSGLVDLCAFLENKDVYNWYGRLHKQT